MRPAARNVLAGLAAFALLSLVSIQTPSQQRANATGGGSLGQTGDQQTGGGPGGAVSGPAAATSAAGGAASATGGAGATAGAAKASTFECRAGANGGNTDKGVFKDKIRLASTHVLSGTGSSFLGSSHVGMEAVKSNVNSQGGICGRLLDLTLRDDQWKADFGADVLRNFIQDGTGYFALPVVPSSEGLTQAIKSKYIDGGGIPVIGTDGMLKEQYQDALVWPVATATVSTMRSMAKYAYDALGTRRFGIVYDNQYKFGREGAEAYKAFVAKLPGATLDAYVGIQPSQPSYPQAQTFNDQCSAHATNKRCEFVAMLLEPGTAASWINSFSNDSDGRRLGFGSKGTGGAQPLFNEKFARDCGEPCNGMTLWTGYNPPIGDLKNLPGVAKYVSDVKAIDPGVDINNQFLEGAYLGMTVFVEALKKVGPNLTRAALRQTMDTLVFKSDLATTLTYAPGKHYANVGAHAFKVVTAAGGFSGFADAQTGFIADPDPGNFAG